MENLPPNIEKAETAMKFIHKQFDQTVEAFNRLYPGQVLILGGYVSGYDPSGECMTTVSSTKAPTEDLAKASFYWSSDMHRALEGAD